MIHDGASSPPAAPTAARRLPLCYADPSSAPRLYYGWVVVGSCMLVSTASAPGHSFGINMLIPYWIEDLHVSRTSVSVVWMLVSIISASALPFAGRCLDRVGARFFLGCTIAPYIAALICLRFVRGVFGLSACLLTLRYLGADSLTLVANTTVNRWFDKRRGRAMAVLSLAESVLLAAPAIVSGLIDLFGYHDAIYSMALILGLMLSIAIMFIRNGPAEHGLAVDGHHPSGVESYQPVAKSDDEDKGERLEEAGGVDGASEATVNGEPSFGQVVRTPLFKLLVASNGFFCVFWAGMNIHAVDFMRETAGLSEKSTAQLIFLPLTMGLTVSSFAFGVVLDRMSTVQRVRATGLVMLGLSGVMGFSLSVSSPTTAVLFGAVYGALVGALIALFGVLYASVFGVRCLGSIQGIATGAGVATSGVGAVLWGAVRDATGSYIRVVYACMATAACCGLGLGIVTVPFRAGEVSTGGRGGGSAGSESRLSSGGLEVGGLELAQVACAEGEGDG